MMKTRQDNDVTDRIGPPCIENEIELSWQIRWVQSMTKTKHNNDVTNCRGAIYSKIKIDLSWPIRQDTVYHEN